MKAAVLWDIDQPLVIEDIDLAKPGRREVLIRTAYAGICRSDLHFAEGYLPFPVPFVPGHESAGIVEAVGEDVWYVQPGDHVVTCLSVFCGTCPECVTGHTNLCEGGRIRLPPGQARRLSKNGRTLNQFANLSSFAERMLVHENALVKIAPDIPLDIATLVGCGVLAGVGAVIHSAKVEPGRTVAVIGCGGVGLSAVSGAVLAGAGRIIAIDILDSKLERARQLGATDVINATDTDAVLAVKELTSGGVHYAFEAIGQKATVEQAFAMLRAGGLATMIGMMRTGSTIEISGTDLLRDRRLQGSAMGGNRFRVDIPNLLTFWQQGRLKLDDLISDRISLDSINDGYAALRAGGVLRQLVDFRQL